MTQKLTPARSAILGVLLKANTALSHAEVLAALNSQGGMDRVTLYRALDWLVDNGHLHKVAGAGRAWKFRVNREETTHRHAHFQCMVCGKTFCLPEVQPTLPTTLPQGFEIETMEFNLKGRCKDCLLVVDEK